MHRSLVIAHYDPHGEVAPHVRRMIDGLVPHSDRLVIVSTAPLTRAAQTWLEHRGEVIRRSNTGHDFASYRAGLQKIGQDTDRIVLLNDSAVFPLTDVSTIFRTMSARGADFWGLTPGYGFEPHVQSYFLCFERSAIATTAWRDFWTSVGDATDRADVIARHEVGLSRALGAAGLSADTYFRATGAQRLRGAARAYSADLGRAVRAHRWRNVAGWVRRLPARARKPEWNAAVALADLAVRHPESFPAVKLSALRDDAYGLDAPALLAAFERRHPAAFEGVRDYLERTDSAYGDRWRTSQSAPRGPLRYRVR